MLKNFGRVLLLSLLLSIALPSVFAQSEQVYKFKPVKIAASESVVLAYKTISDDRKCYNIGSDADMRALSGVSSMRGVTDLLLICRAFYVMGQKLEFELLPSPSYSRALEMVERGRADIAAESIWLVETKARDLHISPPIIREGEFEKGVYTRRDHPLIKLGADLTSLSGYRAVTLTGC